MRKSIKRVLIATSLLCFFCVLSFAAPKVVKEGKSTATEGQTVASPVKKEPASRTAVPVKEPVQTTTDIGSTTPTEVNPTTPSSTTATTPTATSAQAVAYSIDWFVIAAGGGSGTSTNYALDGTAGQAAVGEGTSTNYELNSGFWQNFPTAPPSCCVGLRGSPNGDLAEANILDLTFAVDRIFRGGPPAACFEEGNPNGDLASLNILDLTYFVDRIFRGGPPPVACP